MKLEWIIVSAMMVSLTGCAALPVQADCEQSPAACLSLDAVNARVSRGEFTHVSVNQRMQESTVLTPPPTPKRVPEQVLQIWVAPFQDSAGDHHHAQVIDTVVSPSHWLNTVATASVINTEAPSA